MVILAIRLATAFLKRRHMMGSLLTLSAATKAFEEGYVTVSRNQERFSLYYRMYSKNESSSIPLVVLHGGPYVFNCRQHAQPIKSVGSQSSSFDFSGPFHPSIYIQLSAILTDQPCFTINLDAARVMNRNDLTSTFDSRLLFAPVAH